MAYVRRHWLSSALSLLGIVILLAIALTPTVFSGASLTEAQAQTGTEPEPVDPYLWTRVQKLRQDLDLTNMDLAAMGCDEASATQILTTLKTWCQSNQAALDQRHREEQQIKAALREAIRRINVGTDDPSVSRSLPSLQQDLAVLYDQKKILLDGLAAQLESGLGATQRSIWQAARANTGLPTQLRYVTDLTDQQRQAIHDKLTDRSSQASLNDVVANELTMSQKLAIESVKANTVLRGGEVRDAEASVLPVPELLNIWNTFTVSY